MFFPQDFSCPCGSGSFYPSCCELLHQGKPASNALCLMKSRYTAYAVKDIGYIIRTTHAKNPQFMTDFALWQSNIESFMDQTTFHRLEILEFINGTKESQVTFKAYLIQNNLPLILHEKSFFIVEGNRWLYLKGEIYPN